MSDTEIHMFIDVDTGATRIAVDRTWVSAIFKTKELAIAWVDYLNEAEEMFAALNPPTGKGENMIETTPSESPGVARGITFLHCTITDCKHDGLVLDIDPPRCGLCGAVNPWAGDHSARGGGSK